jgi:hypothetical protein
MDYSILDDGKEILLSESVISTTADGYARLSEQALRESLGWELKPEGLCRGEVCIPVQDREGLVHEEGVDLAAFAGILGRPVVIDTAQSVAGLGTAAASQAAAMATLEAPDFELPDLAGRLHTLSEHRGKKVLLIAYASW